MRTAPGRVTVPTLRRPFALSSTRTLAITSEDPSWFGLCTGRHRASAATHGLPGASGLRMPSTSSACARSPAAPRHGVNLQPGLPPGAAIRQQLCRQTPLGLMELPTDIVARRTLDVGVCRRAQVVRARGSVRARGVVRFGRALGVVAPFPRAPVTAGVTRRLSSVSSRSTRARSLATRRSMVRLAR
jgi:hypothetical protein